MNRQSWEIWPDGEDGKERKMSDLEIFNLIPSDFPVSSFSLSSDSLSPPVVKGVKDFHLWQFEDQDGGL